MSRKSPYMISTSASFFVSYIILLYPAYVDLSFESSTPITFLTFFAFANYITFPPTPQQPSMMKLFLS